MALLLRVVAACVNLCFFATSAVFGESLSRCRHASYTNYGRFQSRETLYPASLSGVFAMLEGVRSGFSVSKRSALLCSRQLLLPKP